MLLALECRGRSKSGWKRTDCCYVWAGSKQVIVLGEGRIRVEVENARIEQSVNILVLYTDIYGVSMARKSSLSVTNPVDS